MLSVVRNSNAGLSYSYLKVFWSNSNSYLFSSSSKWSFNFCQQCNFCLPAEKVASSSRADRDFSRVYLI